jgi:hypothetical protein
MAVTGPIPIQAGFTSMGELADLMMAKRKLQHEQHIKQLELEQRAKEFTENNKYHQGMLGVSQSAESRAGRAEDRAQQLLPFQIQKSQFDMRKTESDLKKAQYEQSILQDLMSGGMNNPNSENSAIGGGGGIADASLIDENNVAQEPQMQQIPQTPEQPTIENLQMGQRMTLRPAQDPGKAKWDRMAGMQIGGIKIPDIQTRVDNGIEYKTYPSGMTIASKIGPSDIEKEEMKVNSKASTDIRKSAREIKSMHDRALKLRKMIEENPNLTNIFQGAKAYTNISNDPKLAEFIQTSRKLQADMARYGSSRGGAVALKWAERAKPSEFRNGKFNLGMINSIIEDSESDYGILNDEYSDMHKHGLSVKLSPSKKDDIVVLNGKKYKMENGKWHEISGGE